MDRSIVHLDLDAFFVSVERKRDASLVGKPLIVGGSSRRGVVAACSYEARAYGVQSAMPMYHALQLCPDAVVVSGDMEQYSIHSKWVTEIIQENSPVFEKASIDEFYIDTTGMDRFYNAFVWAGELRAKIMHECGLPISLALAVNKLVSKVATGEFKPNAEVQIKPGEEQEFFAPLAIEKIPMLGKQTATLLHSHDIHTVRDLRARPPEFFFDVIGKNGVSLWNKAHARDESPVAAYREQKSISTESTFDSDTVDVRKLKSILIAMVEKISFQLREQNKLTSCITVKIRYANFETKSKQKHIAYTASDDTILKTVHELFDAVHPPDQLLRLVGVRLNDFVQGNYQISLFDDTEASINLYEALDRIKHRHGPEKIMRAITFDVSKRVKSTMNMFKG
jgi:DNA polymerase-4